MPRDNDSDKPKRSWAEIDKARDGKRSRSSGQADRDQQRFERSSQYSRYKSAADKFFSGELVPESLREKIDPTGEGKARKDALKRLKDAEDFKQFSQLAKEYVDQYGVPEDPYLMDRLLGHPNEGLVLQVLARLTELAQAGELKPPKSLGERLKSLELGSDDPELQDAAKALAKIVRDLPR